ncbi:MAG: hypothetical protein IPF47_22910 [Gemmatimonadetes bacterium]|nr:hypothetical protein [Gemmatimonadota bacterium]
MRDFAIQKREHDLVIGTFGRGIYIVDDYTALRTTTPATLAAAATLFPVRDALLFVPTQQYGGRGKAFQGEMLYSGDNPPYGAAVTLRVAWNLQLPSHTLPRPSNPLEELFESGPSGPYVVPGRYSVTLAPARAASPRR